MTKFVIHNLEMTVVYLGEKKIWIPGTAVSGVHK